MSRFFKFNLESNLLIICFLTINSCFSMEEEESSVISFMVLPPRSNNPTGLLEMFEQQESAVIAALNCAAASKLPEQKKIKSNLKSSCVEEQKPRKQALCDLTTEYIMGKMAELKLDLNRRLYFKKFPLSWQETKKMYVKSRKHHEKFVINE